MSGETHRPFRRARYAVHVAANCGREAAYNGVYLGVWSGLSRLQPNAPNAPFLGLMAASGLAINVMLYMLHHKYDTDDSAKKVRLALGLGILATCVAFESMHRLHVSSPTSAIAVASVALLSAAGVYASSSPPPSFQ